MVLRRIVRVSIATVLSHLVSLVAIPISTRLGPQLRHTDSLIGIGIQLIIILINYLLVALFFLLILRHRLLLFLTTLSVTLFLLVLDY